MINNFYNNIKKYDSDITSGKDAIKHIDGVAKGIGRRIDEIIKTGTLKELKSNVDSLKKTSAIDTLLSVTGIGPSKAIDLYDIHNISTIEDLKTNM